MSLRIRLQVANNTVFALFGLIMIALGLFLIGVTIYGLVLGFQASIVVGILILFVEPAPLIIGLIYLFTGTNLAEKLAQLLS